MNLHDIAKEVLEVLGTGRQVGPFSKVYPDFGLKHAYNVTATVRAGREARGERSIGRKIGFTNRTIWAEYGVYAPIWGYVYDHTVQDLTPEGLEVSLSSLPSLALSRRSCSALRPRPRPAWTSRRSSVAPIGLPTALRSCSRFSRTGHFGPRTPLRPMASTGSSSSDPVIQLDRGRRSGLASFRASRSIFSATESLSITGPRPTSSTGLCSRCAISPKRWRKMSSVRRSARAKS